MKAIPIILLCMLSVFANADNVKTIDISFDVKDFQMRRNERGLLEISSTKHLISYGDNVTEPGLPLVGIKVAIPQGTEFQGLSIAGSKRTVQTDVLVAPNPLVEFTNTVPNQSSPSTVPDYKNRVYPESIVKYVSTNNMDGYTMVCFLVSPFEYDATTCELSFNERISMQIKLANAKSASMSSSPFIGKNAKPWIKQLVINPEDVEDPTPSETPPKMVNTNPLDYLIVTSSSLLPSFNELVEWKRTKGIRTEVTSIDSIDHNYSGNTIQLKIKNCLYDYYTNRGLKFVLLGGDDTVVPVQYCYASAGGETTSHMPSDLYYGCFGGQFDWNGNGNGICGEVGDNIDFAPSIYVSRLPVRTQEHVAAYLSKLICYEKNPLSKSWHDNILMSGVKLKKILAIGQSDAEAKADNLYTNFILPYWSGSRVKFFDTYTDFPDGANYPLSNSNLQTQLQQGYTFFDMGTHGIEEYWNLENYDHYFKTDASVLQNEGFTIITTVACLTNAFDSTIVNISDPCLSEAFIRNPNSGVVSYLGCSREGWTARSDTTLNSTLQYSYSYEAEFYKALFNNSKKFHNYAEVVAIAKMQKINGCGSYGSDRWVQLGLNPVGDPEMPIYTQTPIEFDSCAISFVDSCIIVNTGIDSCTICVMSTGDDGASYYDVRNYVDSAVFQNINQEVTVCVTKHNYVPKIVKVGAIINIQNENILDSRTYIADGVNVGTHVTDSKPIGNVVFESGTTRVKAKSVKLMSGTLVKKGSKLKITNN